MAKYKVIPGGVCAAKGFSASGVHAGFRANPNKLDLAIIKADVRCAAAGVYTTNKVYGAPIKVDRRGQQRSCQGHYDHRYLRERICH